MKLHKKIAEVLETEVVLELNEEELIATQETLRKVADAVHEIDQKIQEIQRYYQYDCYEHKLTETDLHHVLELLEKHRLNCKDFDELVFKYKDYHEQGDDLRIRYTRYSRYGDEHYHHWSDVFSYDLLKGKKKHLFDQAYADLRVTFPLIGMRDDLERHMHFLGQECRLLRSAADLCKGYSKKTSIKELMNCGD